MRVGLIISLICTLAGCWVANGQTIIGRPLKPLNQSFAANTAVFDGTNDSTARSGALASVADGKAFTFSGWIRFDGGDGATKTIFIIQGPGVSPKFHVSRPNSDKIQIDAFNSAGSQILTYQSTSLITTADGWVHIYAAIDLANAANRHVYINGTEEGAYPVYTDDTIDFVPSSDIVNSVGATRTPAQRMFGAFAEFWFDDSYFNDITKFASGGHPISLGATGSLPTGSAPALYLSMNGSGDSWATDSSGNGNTFTVTGSLGTTTPP